MLCEEGLCEAPCGADYVGKLKLKFNPIDSVTKHIKIGVLPGSQKISVNLPLNLPPPCSAFHSCKHSKGNSGNKCFLPYENVLEEHEVRPNLQPDRTAVRTEGIL